MPRPILGFLSRSATRLHRTFFCGKRFYRFNQALFALSLRGMGILNHESSELSGEANFQERLAAWAGDRPFTALDIGANEGDYARALLKRIPQATIYAFEPHPRTFERLSQASAGLKAFNFGFGEEAGSVAIYDYADRGGSAHASLYAEVIESIHGGTAVATEIQLERLDAFVGKHGLSLIHLLKIDTEGNELKILRGAEKTLREGRVEVIHFEFNEMNVVSRSFFRDFWELLSQDYRFYRMLPDGLVALEEYVAIYHELFAFQNLVAVRKDSTFRACLP